MRSTSQAGLICAMRSRMASTLAWPTVASSAWIWRLMLDSAMWSRSTSVSRPTPLRASASTAHEPTPPMPTTSTCASRIARRARDAVEPLQPAEAARQIGVVQLRRTGTAQSSVKMQADA